jgi:MFS family permease
LTGPAPLLLIGTPRRLSSAFLNVENSSATTTAPKLHRVGTLSYTRAALLQVMFWMLWGVFFFQLLQNLPSMVVPLQLRWEGASDTLIGFKSSLSSLVVFLWFPVVGSWSDRHRGALGRRRPFLLWSIPLILGCLMLFALAKPAGALLHGALVGLGLGATVTAAGCTIGWIMVALVLFMLSNALLVQSYGCLIADVIPPEVMGKFTGLYRALGALGSLAFSRWVLGWVEAYTMQVYAVVGLMYAGVFLLLVWRVKEGNYPPPPPKPKGGRLGAVKTYLRECFSHRFYLNYYLATFFNWASLAPIAYLVFFATESGQPGYAATLGLSLDEFGKVKGWTFLVQIPVFLLVGQFVDRFHPVRIAVVGMFLETITYLGCYWFIHDANSLLVWLCLNQAAIAVYLGAFMALAPRLLPRERYGQFISANGIFGITSLIIAPPLVGRLLDTIRDYRYIYLLCAFCTVMAMLVSWTLYLQWKKLGGDAGYTPPDTSTPPASAAGAGS